MDQINENNQADYLFELGKARSLSGNFLGAIRLIEQASTVYFNQKKYEQYMDTLCLLLRIYKELSENEKIQQIKEELTSLSWEQNVNLNSRVHYILGQCALYNEQEDEAQKEFEKSLIKAKYLLKRSQNPVQEIEAQLEILYPTFGLTVLDIRKNKVSEALIKINSIKERIQTFYDIKISDKDLRTKTYSLEDAYSIREFLEKTSHLREKIALTVEFLYVDALRLKKLYREAERHLWYCYENMQNSKDLLTIVSFFYYLGKNYMDVRNHEQAYIFLNLAKKSIDVNNFKHLSGHVDLCLKQLQEIKGSDYDLVVNLKNNSIIEKHKGKVAFKSQYILMDLFKIFLNRPGIVYTKAQIAKELWQEQYNPSVHNNKIYVTIKRLRELMEPNCQNPTYIFRNKNGYYFNKNAKVLLKYNDGYHLQQPEVSL